MIINSDTHISIFASPTPNPNLNKLKYFRLLLDNLNRLKIIGVMIIPSLDFLVDWSAKINFSKTHPLLHSSGQPKVNLQDMKIQSRYSKLVKYLTLAGPFLKERKNPEISNFLNYL